MDELLQFGPLVLSAVALFLAVRTRAAARRAEARAARVESAVAALPTTVPTPPAASAVASPRRGADAVTGPCPAVLEERLGALEARLSTLAATVSDASIPEPDQVAPMRPPVPAFVEPVASPRSGWRMFP